MKVGVIGGTGFVGSYLIPALLKAGHVPRLLVRPGTANKPGASVPGCETVSGDIADPLALDACLQGTDAAIYLVGILREFPARGITFADSQWHGVKRMLAAARNQGVKQIILMSANGVRAGGTPYQATKFRAETSVRDSGLTWTIFRPSVIFGEPRGNLEFCTQLQQQMVLPPIPAPLFFAGHHLAQAGSFQMAPVHAGDVAAAFVGALGNPAAYGQVFTLCGPDTPSWRQIIQTLALASGRKGKLALPVPAVAVRLAASVLDRFAWFPITRDQITMLLEGNTCTDHRAWHVFGIEPQRFIVENLRYLRSSGPGSGTNPA